jgi:D-arabinose 1-dehydrogenase-like Zn-dependent alcohol dehydrogenase
VRLHHRARAFGAEVGGSLIGGLAETQAMFHFCAKHVIVSNVGGDERIQLGGGTSASTGLGHAGVFVRFLCVVQARPG